jgi:hypothetical protein
MARSKAHFLRFAAALPGLACALLLNACGSVSIGPLTGTSTVTSIQGNSANLSWTPVTQNTDGTALQDLAGYKVYYGNAPYAFTTEVTLANPNATSYVVNDLGTGTWYFAITAYTSSGSESAYSNIASKTID